MPRVITGVHFDLKFNVIDTPPIVTVQFTDIINGREMHGSTRLTDAAASRVFDRNVLAVLNTEIDAKAASVAVPSAITARITEAARLDSEIAKKRAELEALTVLK